MEDLVACSDYGRSQHPDRALSADCGIRNATGKRLPIGGRCREALLYGMQPMIIRVSQWREAEKLRNGTTTSRRRISSPNPNVAVRYLGWIYSATALVQVWTCPETATHRLACGNNANVSE